MLYAVDNAVYGLAHSQCYPLLILLVRVTCDCRVTVVTSLSYS